MNSRKPYYLDARLMRQCVFCGAAPETSDHCPSKVLLDEPYPDNLRVINSCASCNESFSLDEEYVACLIECARRGSARPRKARRPKIRRILQASRSLAAIIENSQRRDDQGNLLWAADPARVRNVILKLSRGHLWHERGVIQDEDPTEIVFMPFTAMTPAQRQTYEAIAESSAPVWPEVGSRDFLKISEECPEDRSKNDWIVVQPRRYRYRVGQDLGDTVQIVLSEYLACSVVWS